MAGRISDYLSLTKPKIVALILVTAFSAMLMTGKGLPTGLVLVTLLGTALSAGSANAINCYIDRDIDAVMRRTRERPIPAGRLEPWKGLAFGAFLGVTSVAVLWATVNFLSAALALAGILFYVIIYTIWLKRSTPQNIVIGGAAGAIGPLIGWAAVTGEVSLTALILFGIVFFWTPPHFWALALFRSEDYARAGVPMLPVVRGWAVTRAQVILYSIILVLTTLALYPLGVVGVVYVVVAAILGGVLLWLAARLDESDQKARQLFFFSVAYLALVFLAAVVDRAV